MGMDFFQAQERAKSRSGRLVVYFGLAVAGIIISLYAVFTSVVHIGGQSEGEYHPIWDPARFATIAALTLAVVGLAALYKIAQFSSGGGAVAKSVGGRKIDPTTRIAHERRLLNVVEEMAIASGVPMPEVYMLDNEEAINAFAAGYRPREAALAFTKGCVERLSRDELQGVVAHEFSHVLNGDMRLNIRLAGIIFGILVIGIIGRILFHVAARMPRSRSSKDGSGGIAAGLIIAGLAMLIIGSIGTFFGRLIQAAVSRQREFLADAAAVQFTRNPAGISGALKKIGGLKEQGKVSAGGASDLAHCFFANALGSSLSGLLATHPPLVDRIKAIDPHFNAKAVAPSESASGAAAGTSGFAGAASVSQAEAPPQKMAITPQMLLGTAGQVAEAHERFAHDFIAKLPERLVEAAHDGDDALALVLALLLSTERDVKARQLQMVRAQLGDKYAISANSLFAILESRPRAERMHLVELCLPCLREMPNQLAHTYLDVLRAIAGIDKQITMLEFVVLQIVRRTHDIAAPEHRCTVSHAAAIVLSAVAIVSHREHAARLFAEATQSNALLAQATFQANCFSNISAMEAALDQLDATKTADKRAVLAAAATIVAHDGQISIDEAKVFKMLATCLDVPVPPLVVTIDR